MKMRPYYGHSTRDNVTPSSGISPLASCKGVPPPPLPGERVGYSEIEENLSTGPLVKLVLKRGAYLFIQRNSRIASILPATGQSLPVRRLPLQCGYNGQPLNISVSLLHLVNVLGDV